MIRHRALGVLAGLLLDRVVRDPVRWHPVAGLGRVAALLERWTHRDDRRAGVLLVALVGGGTGLGLRAAERRLGPVGGGVLTAVTVWSALGADGLERAAGRVCRSVEEDDVAAGRADLQWLCARDASALDGPDLLRATIESVAENTVDAATATVLAGVVGGPGLVGFHRAVNTLDAMVGYRTPRHGRYGWAAARTDDALAWLPARITATAMVATSPLVGGQPRDAIRSWRRDAPAHPSPNAGVVEATTAGALGVRLGGTTNTYNGTTDVRPSLGEGRPPVPEDVRRAIRLSRAATALVTALAVTIGMVVRR